MAIEVAITLDDLPGVNAPVIAEILKTFKKHELQGIYGFINGITLQLEASHVDMLHEWIAAGNLLANHTYSHLNLSQVSPEAYLQDIQKNANLLKTFANTENKYFRYPFLDEGDTYEKRNLIRDFLSAENFQIVPVTIYLEEHRWDATFINCVLQDDVEGLKRLKNNIAKHAVEMLNMASGYARLLLGRDIKHIFLLHQTLFNAYFLDAVLTAFNNADVNFIPLAEALGDEVYQINPDVLGDEYYGFLGQLRAARQIPLNDELRTATRNLIKRYSDPYCSF